MNGILMSTKPFVFCPLPDGDPDATHEILKDGDNLVVRKLKLEHGNAGHSIEN